MVPLDPGRQGGGGDDGGLASMVTRSQTGTPVPVKGGRPPIDQRPVVPLTLPSTPRWHEVTEGSRSVLLRGPVGGWVRLFESVPVNRVFPRWSVWGKEDSVPLVLDPRVVEGR